MKSVVVALVISFFIAGCSFSTKPNLWEQKSATSFESYKKQRLLGNDALAQEDLHRAIEHAKQSADLKPLGRVYVGACALDIAFGKRSTCKRYKEIADVVDCGYIENYYRFIQKDFSHVNISQLPQIYQDFARAMQEGDYTKANEAIKKIDVPSSKLLAIALLGDRVWVENIRGALDLFSHYGYKAGVVYLLKKYEAKLDDPVKKQRIKKKLEILLK